LKIITTQQLGALLSEDDPKSQNLMDDIFVGPDASSCDGDITMYSNLMFILDSEIGEKLEEPPSV
jgi:hypothetical protein|tara:strand:+ start:27 stop:221 length:195 start_codon:yes stop_codon:yes gene_type:complete